MAVQTTFPAAAPVVVNMTALSTDPAATDWTVPQDWDRYTAAEHALWDRLFRQQCALLPGRVTPEFLDGVKLLGLHEPGIPDFERLSEKLLALTGWRVVAVPGLVPDEVFFEHLANRRFVSGSFLRKPEQVDYLQEPDVFHDVFGHVPLLASPVFADYLQAYGQGGQRAQGLGVLPLLARLYWYTVEFGLVHSAAGLRIYGAGIVSSRTESLFSLDDSSPNRLGFDLRRVMRTRYRIDDFQQTYFVIDSFENLLEQTLRTDFGPLYQELVGAEEIDPSAVLPSDRVLTRGTQALNRA
jgi:phenylalanine-4-hydroxylase